MKTRELIIKILKEEENLEAGDIARRIGLTYDTTSKHLKKMTEEGRLKRRTGERPEEYGGISWRGGNKPWVYYYSLNKQNKRK